MAKRPAMVSWYNPVMLVQTAVRVAISTIFGQFADKREALAAANAIEPQPFDISYDYSRRAADGDFWFDFVADTGDGWDATYAVARLLAQPGISLGAGTTPLPRGRILIMGGDQVYPTASREEYHARLLDPFDAAYARHRGTQGEQPDLYAIPGNHDWYDGLNSFFGLFCRRRIMGGLVEGTDGKIIGGRRTQQTRSYFAIRLPHNWWLWGTDSQLEGYIDQPQVDFFQHVAKKWMARNSGLILCVGEPSWIYADQKHPEKKFSNFAFLESIAASARKGHRLRLVLTGDSHHYARYVEGGGEGEAERHYVTCGGGGAFLHPTHPLKDRRFLWPPPGNEMVGEKDRRERHFRLATHGDGKESLFPDRAASSRLTWRNLAFAWLNPVFAAAMFVNYLIFNWLLDANARMTGKATLANALGQQERLRAALASYAELVFTSPWPLILLALSWGGYHYFADARSKGERFAMGGIHWLVQTLVAVAVTWLVLRGFGDAWPGGFGRWTAAVSLLAATAAAALASTTLFGVYLLVSLNIFGRHGNEAFSSLRIAGYKSILRMRIDAGGVLTLFPIGLRSVPREARDAARPLLNRKLKPRLIEPPVRIAIRGSPPAAE